MILNKALKWAEKVLGSCCSPKKKVPDLELARPGDEVPLAIAVRRWIRLLGRVCGPTQEVVQTGNWFGLNPAPPSREERLHSADARTSRLLAGWRMNLVAPAGFRFRH
jgi:hypothetical protein